MTFRKLKKPSLVAMVVISISVGYTADALGAIIIDNFTTDPTTGGFSSETVNGGLVCCPFEFQPNFVEEHAVAFTVDRRYRLDAFEFLLDDDGAKDLLRIDLSIGSSTNPGGSEPALNFSAPDRDNSLETWVLTDAVPNIIDTFHVDSIIDPVLQPGKLYWVSMSPGEPAPFESIIRIEWVSAEEADPLVQAFGRRNNVNGGQMLEPALNFSAPDRDNSLETWVLTDAVPNIIDTFHVDSIIDPVLQPGKLYWVSMSPGEPAPFESIIRIEWVSAEEADPLVQAFGRRNNVNGGNIGTVIWSVGQSNMARTLRVFATPIPEPSAFTLFGISLAGMGFMGWRRKGRCQAQAA